MCDDDDMYVWCNERGERKIGRRLGLGYTASSKGHVSEGGEIKKHVKTRGLCFYPDATLQGSILYLFSAVCQVSLCVVVVAAVTWPWDGNIVQR